MSSLKRHIGSNKFILLFSVASYGNPLTIAGEKDTITLAKVDPFAKGETIWTSG